MSRWMPPLSWDCRVFLDRIRAGESPYDAARAVGRTATRFRGWANRNPEFEAAYQQARKERRELLRARKQERRA